jgi:hypothetical protein
MINVFYESLPEALEINGREYPIITDFREWLRFSDMLKSDIPENYKLEFLEDMFLEEMPSMYSPEDIELVMNAITDFLSLAELEFPMLRQEEEEPGNVFEEGVKKAIYYEQDAPYIISAFQREYQIDLLSVEYLHWWKFRMLLDGLSEESQIKKRIYWRTCDVSKMDQKERMKILSIRRRITIPEDEYVGDEDIGNAFI